MRAVSVLWLGLALITLARGAGAAEAPGDSAQGQDLPPPRPPAGVLGRPDSVVLTPYRPGALEGEEKALIPADRPPWERFAAPGDTLVLGRYEVDRVGAHQLPELLSRIPGIHALEVSATAPLGAVTQAGSFALPPRSSDAWTIRQPRMEGMDLSRLLLDRLGPGATWVPVLAAGEFRVIDTPLFGPETPEVRLAPAEPVGDSASSRMAIETGSFGLAGGGILFSDHRGRLSYGFGADNTRAKRSGSIQDASPRVSIVEMGWAADRGRLGIHLRNSEIPIGFKDGRRINNFDQGMAADFVAGDTLGPAWALRVVGRDDRLSGSELPGVEFKRKGLVIEVQSYERPGRPVYARIVGERDWFAVRHAEGAYAPRVTRIQGEAGGHLAVGAGRIDLAGGLRVSDRHALKGSGRAELSLALPAALVVGMSGGRVQHAPTYDQEVLVPENPVADPERHDSIALRVVREGLISFGVVTAWREITHQPFVTEEIHDRPWPQFAVTTSDSRHWEVRGSLSFTGGPLGMAAGAWGSRFFNDESFGRGDLAPFVPEEVGRAFASLRISLLGGDLVVMPRAEFLAVGDRTGLAGERLPGYGRLDAAVISVVGGDVDLEVWARNLLDRRYPLAVYDPSSGDLYADSGRMAAFALRWRFLN